MDQAPPQTEDDDTREAREEREVLEEILRRRQASREVLLSDLRHIPLGSIAGPRVEVRDHASGLEVCIVDADGVTMDRLHGAKAMIFLSGFLRCEVWASDRPLDIAARAGLPCEINYRLPPLNEANGDDNNETDNGDDNNSEGGGL